MAMRIWPNEGARTWSGGRDVDGNRDYKITWLVYGDYTDGPAAALAAEGLPVPGDAWAFGTDFDSWAFCRQNATMTPVVTNEPGNLFLVEQTFSTKPDTKRCKDQQIDDPLLVPDRLSGSTNTYQEEIVRDVDGIPITNSAFEQFHGPQIEFDKNRSTVKIEQNVPDLQIDLCNSMVDTVNDDSLWGMEPRCIKLSKFSWEAKFYGQCFEYYTRTFEFEIRQSTTDSNGGFVAGFDRSLLDEGTKVIFGHWGNPQKGELEGTWIRDRYADGSLPNVFNPSSYIRLPDIKAGNLTSVILDGFGGPLDQVLTSANPGAILVQYYQESNFLLLGIPTTL